MGLMSRLCAVVILISGFPSAAQAEPVRVSMKTSQGEITLELNRDKAPQTVENFLMYAGEGFYENTLFHRVIKGFMIQGGGYTPEMGRKPGHKPIENEADNGLRNLRGTIAMARTNHPHSATSQFFINHADNSSLDHRDQTLRGWGYAVFGKVVEGMDVVDKIAGQPTGPNEMGMRDVPVSPVIIERVEILAQ